MIKEIPKETKSLYNRKLNSVRHEILENYDSSILKLTDISECEKDVYDSAEKLVIAYAIFREFDVKPYLGKDLLQMCAIHKGNKAGIDTSVFNSFNFNGFQMNEICIGMIRNLNVELYTNPVFDYKQMIQIRKGLELGLDVSLYCDPVFDSAQMSSIRQGLFLKQDASKYANSKISDKSMQIILHTMLAGKDTSILCNLEYNSNQIQQLSEGLLLGLDIDKYSNPRIHEINMYYIKRCMLNNLDYTPFITEDMTSQVASKIYNQLSVDLEYDLSSYL